MDVIEVVVMFPKIFRHEHVAIAVARKRRTEHAAWAAAPQRTQNNGQSTLTKQIRGGGSEGFWPLGAILIH